MLALLALALASADVSPDPKSLAVPAADHARAVALIGRLASGDFAAREAAARDLRALGRLALPALRHAAKTAADPEVQVRCERLVPAAVADDFDARVATFLADADGKFEHDLPAWNEFRAATGKAADARKVFAGLVRSPVNRELLGGLAVGKDEFARRVQLRRQELMAKLTPARGVAAPADGITLEDVVALLVADVVLGDKGVGRAAGGSGLATAALFGRPKVGDALRGAADGSALRVLLDKWADSREVPASLYAGMRSATMAKLPGLGRKLAKKLLATDGVPPLHRAYAALSLGQLGGKDELPALAALMADDGLIQGLPNVWEARVQDVALAVAALVTGRKPTDFGFREVAADARLDDLNIFLFRFATPEERAAALGKWAALEPKLPPVKRK